MNKNARALLPFIGRITNDLVLPNFGLFGWGLTLVELAAGILLVLGFLPRIGALIALGPVVFLFFVYLSNDRWMPEQVLERVPPPVLALVPYGCAGGLDGRRDPSSRATGRERR